MESFVKVGLLVTSLCIVSSHQESCRITSNSELSVPSFATHTGIEQGGCCDTCKSAPNCKAFQWNENDNGTCLLMPETGPVFGKIGYSVGILADASDSTKLDCSIRSFSHINLPESAAYRGQTQETCNRICVNTSSCKGFVWDANEGGSCWLKVNTGPLLPSNHFYVGIMSSKDEEAAQISFTQFSKAVTLNRYPRPSQAQYNAFMEGLPKGSITNKQEAAMALAQLLHESDGLRAKREYRCRTSGCPGEYVTPGCDARGQHYFGRGYIQLTWCYNYKAASQYLFGDGNRLVRDSDMVARDENLAWNTAFWFWKMNVHCRNGVANGDFGVTTRAINGKLECDTPSGHRIAKKRFQMYGQVRVAFGLPGKGNERGCYN